MKEKITLHAVHCLISRLQIINLYDKCVAYLQKGPHVAIYQSRENRSESKIYQFSLALYKIISRHLMLVNIVLHHSIYFFSKI